MDRGPGSNPLVLVVDDDRATRNMIRVVLQSSGFSVVSAADGDEGLAAALEAGPFDAVVLDLRMPGMDGRALYRRLRDHGDPAPMVIVSGYGAEAARDELGAEAALAKPFDPNDLINLLQDVIEEASLARTAVASLSTEDSEGVTQLVSISEQADTIAVTAAIQPPR